MHVYAEARLWTDNVARENSVKNGRMDEEVGGDGRGGTVDERTLKTPIP